LFSMTMILISVYFFVESSWWDTFSSNSNYNYETCFSPLINHQLKPQIMMRDGG
jgi:hypothetical protein